jgi:hypothetical protein
VTHVHGAAGVGDESDGYAEAWFLPDAANIPGGYAAEGTWYDFFKSKAFAKFGVEWERGSATFQYPNLNRASTLWYHDHALGMTRLNVYAGPAGFYLLRGGPGDDVVDGRTGKSAVLPGPAPSLGDAPGRSYFEIPLAIQDRSFNSDGSLFYPDTRAFFGDADGPYLPESDVPPIWNPEFFGNTLMVNGRTWPFLDVEQRRYRLRLLNGCQARFVILDFSRIAGVRVTQIGNEGGFLPEPFNLTDKADNRLLLAPAETRRCDRPTSPTCHEATTSSPTWVRDEPFAGGAPGEDFPLSDPEGTGQVLQFRVSRRSSPDKTTAPEDLVLPIPQALSQPVRTRRLFWPKRCPVRSTMRPPRHCSASSLETRKQARRGRPGAGWIRLPRIHRSATPRSGKSTTRPRTRTRFTSTRRRSRCSIVRRRFVDETEGTVRLTTTMRRQSPSRANSGRKDTVIAYPDEVTRIQLQFNTAGQYVWHCHLVEHEDQRDDAAVPRRSIAAGPAVERRLTRRAEPGYVRLCPHEQFTASRISSPPSGRLRRRR